MQRYQSETENIQLASTRGKYGDQSSAEKIQTKEKFLVDFCLALVSQDVNRIAVCFRGASSTTDKFRIGWVILMSQC